MPLIHEITIGAKKPPISRFLSRDRLPFGATYCMLRAVGRAARPGISPAETDVVGRQHAHEEPMITTGPAETPWIDPALGPPPYRRGHYAPEDFFCSDPADGVVTTVYGQRVLRVSDDFLAALHRSLEQEVGERAGAILYEIGRRWGAADMRTFTARAPEEFGTDYEKVHMHVLMETWWWPRIAGGWGQWSFDLSRAPQRFVCLDVRDSAEARALTKLPGPACHLYAGFFAGGLSHLARRDLECVELQCRAAGADICRFLFTTAAQAQTASQRRDAGETAAEIVHTLAEVS